MKEISEKALLNILEDLQEAEEKYKNILSSTEDIIYSHDNKGIITFISANVSKYGYNHEDLIGKKFDKLIHPDDRKRIMKQFKKTIKTGKTIASEFRLKTNNGYVWLEEVGKVKKENGKVVSVNGVLRDITGRKKAEEKFKKLFEKTPDIIAVLDLKGNISDINPAGVEELGYEKKEIIGENFTTLIPKEKQEYAKKHFARLSKTKKSIPTEQYLKTKSGEIKIFSTRGSVTNNSIMFILRNITERKQTEKDLKRSEEKYKDMFDTIDIGIYRGTAGAKGKFIDANPALIKIFEAKSKEELFKYNISDVYQNSKDRKKISNKIVKKGFIKNEILELKTLKGKKIWCKVNSYKKKDKEGNVFFEGYVEDITKEKEAEDKLEKEREIFKETFNNINDALYLHEINENGNPGKFLEVNQVACDMLGYSKEEFKKMSPKDIDSEENKKNMPKIMKKLFSERSVQFEGQHITKDGRKVPVELSSHLFEIGGEKRIITATRDITERKKAEEEIEKREKFLNKLIDSIPNPLFVKDKNHKWIILNKAFCDFMGHKKEELIGKSDHDFFPKKEADVFWKKDNLVFKNKKENVNEEKFTDSKGFTHTIVTKKDVFQDYKDNDILVGIISDITEIKKTEEELSKLFEFSHSLICIADLKTAKFKRINSAFTKLLGYSEKEILGKSFIKFIHPDDKNKTKNVIKEKLLAGEDVLRFKNRYICKDGSYKWLDWESHPVKEEGITYAIARDITKEKEAEEKIRKEKEKLEDAQKIGKIATWNLDIVNNVLEWTEQNYHIFEVKKDSIQKIEDFLELVHPDDKKYVAKKWNEAMKEKSYDIEHRILVKGKVKWVREKAKIKFEKGKAVNATGITQDITEQKEAEEKLKESEEMLKNIIEHSDEVFYIHDNKNVIQYISPQCKKILGYTPEEMKVKWTTLTTKNPINKKGVKKTKKALKTGKKQKPYLLELKKKNGKKILVEINESPLKKNRKVVGITGALKDVTK